MKDWLELLAAAVGLWLVAGVLGLGFIAAATWIIVKVLQSTGVL